MDPEAVGLLLEDWTHNQGELAETESLMLAVLVAAILRHLHAVVTTGRAWGPTITTHGPDEGSRLPPRPEHSSRRIELTVGASRTRH